MRIGPHVLHATPAALAWSRNAPIVKAVGPESLECLKVAPPNAIRIYRQYFDNQSTWESGATYARWTLDALGGYRHPLLYVELLNECGAGAWKEQARQVIEAYPMLHAAGVKLCGPCWSTGDYGEAEWRGFIEATRGKLDALAVHCYWSHEVGATIWNAYRYRQFWQLGDPPLLITECGEDVVRDGAGGVMVGNGGWRKQGASDAEYLAELAAYNAGIEEDAYVLGATVFTAGARDGQWSAYDTDALDVSRLYAIPTAPPDATGNEEQTKVNFDFTSPNHGGPIDGKPVGIVVHSTRGGTTSLEREFDASVNWHYNPASNVSSHAIVSPTRTARPVSAALQAWHAGAVLNKTHLGVELCQAKPGDLIPDDELKRAAAVCAEWSLRYDIPLVWDLYRGYVQHKDTPQGIAQGSSDIGPGFSGYKFMTYVALEVDRLKAAANPQPPDAVTDAFNGIWHYSNEVLTSCDRADLTTAHRAALDLKERVVRLKAALGR